MSRRLALLLPLLALPALGPATCPSGGTRVAQQYLHVPAYVEAHTPGSGAPEELAASENVQSILGTDPDLNLVSYVRTFVDRPDAPAPRAIVIFVPGFLGGGGTFSPLAKQLVRKFNGNVEVWSVDRRPNLLEDRRGTGYAKQLLASATNDDEVRDALYAGTFFYLPEDEFFDTNQNGEVDPPTELPDALGNARSYVALAQDDVRFMAHWGVDTYVRDWKSLVDTARAIVGPDGLVLFGGHSQGTYWTSVFAAYDFDPDPAVVDAGHAHVDGLVLLEGGGGRGPSAGAPDFATYESRVAELEMEGGPAVFLADFQGTGIVPFELGPAAEMAGLAGEQLPDESAIVQRTRIFSGGTLALLFGFASFDNRAIFAAFIDDDHQPIGAFRGSFGFSDNGPNLLGNFGGSRFYAIQERDDGELRTWKDYDDPTLPTCPPNVENVSPGCALLDNGPRPLPTDMPRTWGHEVEVSSLPVLMAIQTAPSNFVEWYFASGRPNLDGSYGVDSSALVAEAVAATASEGPLNLTQNANVDVPVLCIGGSNGLAPSEASYAAYLGSIATPPADQQIELLEGYAHLDVLTAENNGAVPILTDWINRLLVRKLLGP